MGARSAGRRTPLHAPRRGVSKRDGGVPERCRATGSWGLGFRVYAAMMVVADVVKMALLLSMFVLLLSGLLYVLQWLLLS